MASVLVFYVVWLPLQCTDGVRVSFFFGRNGFPMAIRAIGWPMKAFRAPWGPSRKLARATKIYIKLYGGIVPFREACDLLEFRPADANLF